MSLPQNTDPDKTDHLGTCVATLTGAGRSAVAVIGVRGDEAAAILARCFQPATQGRFLAGQIRYGLWSVADSEAITGESVVITPIDTDQFEIHCHGGSAAIERIIGDLRSLGATPLATHQWLSASDSELLTREAQSVLWQCVTTRTAAIALDQVRGAMVRWAGELLEQLQNGSMNVSSVQSASETLYRSARFGTRLATGFRVVLVGPPNVGKSSLLNAIVGYDRSITLDVAGTTRDVLHAETVIDGLPIRLSDTAGIRESEEPIEKEGIARARLAADEADLILWISQPGQQADVRQPVGRGLSVLNKCDLLQPGTRSPTAADPAQIRTNALTGEGVDGLIAAIAKSLADSIPVSGAAVPITDRQARLISKIGQAEGKDQIAEILRELLGVAAPGVKS